MQLLQGNSTATSEEQHSFFSMYIVRVPEGTVLQIIRILICIHSHIRRFLYYAFLNVLLEERINKILVQSSCNPIFKSSVLHSY